MKNLMRNFILFLVVLMFGFSGCEVFTDLETGQRKYRIDPNQAAKFEQGGKFGIELLNALSFFMPALIPVATGAAGIFATWKKMKPKLTEAQTKENMANNAGMVLAELIEEIKVKHPDIWSSCKDNFKKAIGIGTICEQTIRGFRGLTPTDTNLTGKR